MQTTLLGIAIALILALGAALVSPLLVDWGRFRPSIEAEASRLVGAPVRITGPIDASILPTPSLKLRGLEVGPSHAGTSIRARALNVELSLGALLRGHVRASELHLVGPNFTLGLDGTGRLILPPVAPGFDPDRLSIERLNIEDGYAVLADARSGARINFDKLWFNGDMRSLVGPFKGDGAFVIAGNLYAYRIVAGRAEDGAVKLRLNIDPLDRPLAMEAEGVLTFAAAPRFEGAVSLSRPAGVALPTGKAVAQDPWRLTSKVKATGASALLEALEFQYGPEERAVKLTGTAEIKFGDEPRFDGVLSAAQIDLDRALAATDARQLPMAAFRTLAEKFSGALRPPVPARLGVSVETLTLAGSTLYGLRGDVVTQGDAWNLEGFELRVPGLTQVNLSGRLDLAPGHLGFAGPVSVDSTDPTGLLTWLEGGSAAALAARMKPFRARGDVTLSSEKIALERLNAEIDRKGMQGRLAYFWAAGPRPARLEADLNAADLDLDALLSFADAARGSTTFETPREITLNLGIGRAVLAGVAASDISARFRHDRDGAHIERLAVGNFGGNSFEASGRIDTSAPPPQGTIALRLDARNLAGLIAPAEKFAPDAADLLRRLVQRAPSAQLNASLSLERAGAAKLAIEGRSGDVRLTLRGETAAEAMRDLSRLAAANLRLDAKFESEKGRAVADLLNLGNIVAVDPGRPGQVSLVATGPLGDMQIEGRLLGGGLDVSAKGKLRLGLEPKAELRLAANADVRPLIRRPEPLPIAVTGNLGVTRQAITLDDFSGSFARIPVRGRIGFNFAPAARIDGKIETDSIDASATLAALIGMPASGNAQQWSSAPFTRGVLEGIEGRIEWRTARIDLTPHLVLRDARGVARFGRSEIVLTDIEGGIAGGKASGQLVFHPGEEGVSANGRLRLTNADAAVLLAREGNPVKGRLALQLDLEGTGRSPQTLIGSLGGNGVVSLAQGELAALNPKVFETTARAVDQGTPIEVKKIGDIATIALESGALAVPSGEGVITVSNGQLRLANLITQAEGADLTVAGSFDLVDQSLSARVTLSGGKNWPQVSAEPVISVFLSGSLNNPKRTLDASVLSTWLTLRAVEQQSKQLEAMEAKRRQPTAARPSEESGTTSSAPAVQTLAPPMPPAIEVPPVPNIVEQRPARAEQRPAISEQRPARAPARTQSGTAAQPRPVPQRPLQLLPGAN